MLTGMEYTMFLPPPPGNNDDKTKFSEQPLPPAPSRVDNSDLASDAPQGDELHEYVLDCLNKGSSKAEIRKQLIAFGYASGDAERTVEDVAEWRRNYLASHAADPNNAHTGNGYSPNANLLIGGGICLLGIVVTVGTCMASQQGGTYTIAYGAIIFGAIQFFRGMSQSNQSNGQ